MARRDSEQSIQRFLLETMALHEALQGDRELPQPYRDLMDLAFWEGLPTVADLKQHGLCRLHDQMLWPSKSKTVQDSMHDFGAHVVMETWASKFSFAVPSCEILQTIAEHSSRIVEVGAGSGFWAHLLGKVSIDVVATDKAETSQHATRYASVEDIDGLRAVEKYPDRDLMCCWPHMNAEWLTAVAGKIAPDRLMIYIGEFGGCTGHDSFHSLLGDDRYFIPVACERMAYGAMAKDGLFIYRRTANHWELPVGKPKRRRRK